MKPNSPVKAIFALRSLHLDRFAAVTLSAGCCLVLAVCCRAAAAEPVACAPAPTGLLGWWPFEGTASDEANSNAGMLAGSPSFAPGLVGQALVLDGGDDGVDVPAAASLNLGASPGFTIELWINPTSIVGNQPLVEWNNRSGLVGLHFWLSQPPPAGSGDGSLFANFIDDGGTAHWFHSPANLVPPNVWSHVALTYDKASGLAAFFVNGTAVEQGTVGTMAVETRYEMFFGRRPQGTASEYRFQGSLDEISFYGRALATEELQAIVSAGAAGKCRTATAPSIVQQPHPVAVRVGRNASFTVLAKGTPPLAYQWQFDDSPIGDETNATLRLTNVQPDQAGPYSVIVTNASGSVTSSPALLTVNPAPICTPPPVGLMAWWPLNGTGDELVSGTTMTLFGDPSFAEGEVAQGLWADGANDSGHVAANAALDVGAGSGLTLEMWIQPLSLTQPGALVEWSDSAATVGVHFWTAVSSPFSGGGPGSLFANLIDTSGRAHHVSSPADILTTNQPQHVALTYDRASGVAVLYLNGASVAQTNVGSFIPETRPDVYFGQRLLGGLPYRFQGLMDEVGFYNRALAEDELAAIYESESAGKCASTTPVAPTIRRQPQSLTVFVGQTAKFTVAANGTPPLGYQWLWNGNPMDGETNATLVLPSVQPAQAGDYAVEVRNAAGSLTSSNAVLVVNPPPPCASAPAGLTAWWPLEGDAVDRVSGNLVELAGAPAFAPGVAGQALELDGIDDAGHAVANPSLDIGAGSGLTIELWIKPTSVDQTGTLVEWSDHIQTLGVHLCTAVGSPYSGGGSGSLFANLIDVEGRAHHVSSPAGLLQPGAFQHVALTYDRTSGTAAMYVNGTAVTQTNVGSFVPETRTDLFLGRRLLGGTPYRYRGEMDEVSLYNRALTSEELTAIYQAGAAGKCPTITPVAPTLGSQPQSLTVWSGQAAAFTVSASGSAPLSYQWRFNDVDIPGATNPSLTLSNVQPSQAGNYSVRVSNIAGSILSDAAVLTVQEDSRPPAITRQPVSQSVDPGRTASFSVQAVGAAPLTYQWLFNEAGIPGANQSTLAILNAQESDAGTYSVVVSNAFGFAVSEEAALTVTNRFIAGTVNFANHGGAPDAPVFDADGVTKLSGATYRAELLAGPTPSALAVVGGSAPFVVPGCFIGGTRAIPTVAAGLPACVQVRVWDLADGTNYDQALANGGKVGASTIFSVTTGGAGIPPSVPANLTGLESFSLRQNPHPAPIAAFIAPGRRFSDGSMGWILSGQPGARYCIERSTNLTDWTALIVVTTTDGTAQFSDRAWSSGACYRARLLD